jgi:hypothetical protein
MALRNTAHYESSAMDAANEYTPMFFCKDFRTVILTMVAASSANATVKVYGSSMEDVRPSLASAVSATNEYTPIEVVNLDSGDNVDWSAWIAWAWSADWTTKYEVNTNGLNWIGVKMTARTAGSVTVTVDMYDNS